MLLPIDRQGALSERIDEATGNTIEYGADNGFERSARKSVLHGIDHLAGIFCKGLELPSARQHGERAIDQVDGNQFGMMMRSEEHTSELQSLLRISYAVFCLKKKTNNINKYK